MGEGIKNKKGLACKGEYSRLSGRHAGEKIQFIRNLFEGLWRVWHP